MSDERREDERAPLEIEVGYTRLNTFFADYTRNLSRGGMFIRTTKPLPVGTSFTFVMVLPPAASGAQGTRLELSGVVKWVSPASADDERSAGMGVGFVFQDEAERARVEGLVSDLMRASLGPSLTKKLLGQR